jgi:hypothetical protein
MNMYQRKSMAAAAIALGACWGGIPASHALNTDLVIGLCSHCVKTADYEQAAWSLISSHSVVKFPGNYKPITYTAIMSNTSSSTAYIKISGAWGTSSRHLVFIPSSFTPVDAGGNSLAGQSEAYLESYYTQVDWSVFGVFRSDPTLASFPSSYQPLDFVGTPDTDVSADLVNTFGLGAGIPEGTPVTVTFSDGVVAIFVRTSNTSSDYAHWWVWGNVAHNAKNICVEAPGTNMLKICGAPIDRSGNVLIDINTSGSVGGSAVNPAYDIYPQPIVPGSPAACSYSSYATLGDDTIGGTGYGPC